MFTNTRDAQDAQKESPLFLHPHDPNVEKEYETLIQAWKNQLIDKTPASPSYEYIRFAWIRLMDHYLDQQWLDSKQMLQCAQAWSARDAIGITEAVHTMNILSLKSMQRSLDARQELLQALGDPNFMVGFGVDPIDITLNPLAGTEGEDEDDEEEEESQVHAPLLVKHNNTPIEESFSFIQDEAIITSDIKKKEAEDLIRLYQQREGPRLTSSSSTPNLSIRSSSQRGGEEEGEDVFSLSKNGFARKYESYYQQLNKASFWKEIEVKQDQDSIISDDQSVYSNHSDEMNADLQVNGSGIQWKSWFVEEQQVDRHPQQQQPLVAPDEPIIFEREFADEKVETDACLADLYKLQTRKNQPFFMVRSESSISAFRPISNNLAPRCQPQQQLDSLELVEGSSSYSIQCEQSQLEKSRDAAITTATPTASTITKSRSFPTKASLSTSARQTSSHLASSPPPPMPTRSTTIKERNFTIRSIVGKKVSLSKLFGSRKPSTSSSASYPH